MAVDPYDGSRTGVGALFNDAVSLVAAKPAIIAVVFLGAALSIVPLVGWISTIAAQVVALSMLAGPLGIREPDSSLLLRGLFVLLASVVVAILIGIGFVLLILPGIFLAVKFALINPALVLDGSNLSDALSDSYERTKGNFGVVFVVEAVLFLVNLLLFGLAAVFLLDSFTLEALDRSLQTISTATGVLSSPIGAVSVAVHALMYYRFAGTRQPGAGDPGRNGGRDQGWNDPQQVDQSWNDDQRNDQGWNDDQYDDNRRDDQW